MKPGPKRQADVNEDFSDKKAPSQIAVQTFWQNIEPYIRDVREDDLAMLNFKADTPDSYIIPPRGRHYTEIWDEEDGNPPGSTSRYPVPSARLPPNGAVAPIPHTIPTEIQDANLVQENRGLGPLTERVVAAVIGGPDIAEVNKEAAEKKPEPEISSREGARVDVAELEEKVKKELRSVLLLGEHEEVSRTLHGIADSSLTPRTATTTKSPHPFANVSASSPSKYRSTTRARPSSPRSHATA